MSATGALPGPRLPALAQSLWWATRPESLIAHCHRRYGNAFALRLLQGGRWVFLSDPADVRTIFTGDPEVVTAGSTHELLEPVFGPRSVHLIDGEDHLRQRRMISPPLRGERLRDYAELIAELTRAELANWPLGREFPVLPRLRSITLELIMRGIFGFRDQSEGSRVRALVEKLLRQTMGNARVTAAALIDPRLAKRLGASSLAFGRTTAALRDAIGEEIDLRRRERDGARDDLLTLLLAARDDEGWPLEDDELRDNLITLLVAGHETTATALAWAFHSLARHPTPLRRLTEEIDSGATGPYLDATTRETLRLHPAVPLAMRRLRAAVELQCGQLPAGSNVAVCICLLHRLPELYENPSEFRPERFLERPEPYGWAPFGGGTRRCPGARLALTEIGTVLRTVLEARRLEPVQSAAEGVVSLALRPSRGARIVLTART